MYLVVIDSRCREHLQKENLKALTQDCGMVSELGWDLRVLL